MAFFLSLGKPLLPRIDLFIFNVHLVAFGIIFESAIFLGTKWALQRVECKVLVLL